MTGLERGREEMLIPHGFSIAIDGPVASGKGTVATILADKLGGFFMNTGGMYRAVALYCIENGVDMTKENPVAAILPQVNVEIINRNVFLNGTDVTERITHSDTSDGSSKVAVYGEVRKALVKRQQEIGQRVIEQGQVVIAEGRDAGTKIFPGAALKIFLTASPEVRAKRRGEQYRNRGIITETDKILEELRVRDERDLTRAVDPLVSDPEKHGYWVVDDTNETPEETVERIFTELTRRGLVKDDQH